MAALFLSSDEMQGIYGLSDLLDEKLIEILGSRDGKNHANISKRIIASFTKSALLETRRKIFEYAIEKEKSNRALATDAKDAFSDDSDDRSGFHMQDMSKWQLTNRGTKPRITEDIMSLALFIDDPGEDFPLQVLAQPTTKPKAKADLCKRKGSPTCTVSAGLATPIISEKGPVDPIAVQKEFERFIIREVCGSDVQDPRPDLRAVSVTQLNETSTSTCDLVSSRSLSTQTNESSFNDTDDNDLSTPVKVIYATVRPDTTDVSLKSGLETLPSGDPVKSASNTSSEIRESPQPVCLDGAHDLAPTDLPTNTPELVPKNSGESVLHEPAEVNKSVTKEASTVRLDNISNVNSTVSSHSDTSLMEYIDSEYDSIKNMYKGKAADKVSAKARSDYDKRLAELEKKYETVVKRLNFVEKDHTREICEIKAEQRRITYFSLSNDSVGTPSRKRFRRHSSSGTENISTVDIQHNDVPATQDQFMDNSVWDVNESDVVVDTQDSQGNRVSTRATPLHLKEIHQASKPKPSDSSDTAPKIIAQSKPKPSTSKQADNNDIRHYFDGSEDMPPASTPMANRKQHNDSGGQVDHSSPDQAVSEPSSGNRTTSVNQQASNKGSGLSNPGIAPGNRSNASGKGPNHPPNKSNTKQATSTAQSSKPGPGKDAASRSNSNSATNFTVEKDQYSMVVTRNGWDKSGNANKKKGKKKPMLPIRGLVDSETKEMFVKGLRCAGFRTRKELEDSIKAYVEEKGIFLVHHRVLAFKTDRTTVGCKMVVCNDDMEKITSKGFWPPGIWIREWFDDPLSDEEHQSGNDRSSDAEST